jgi:hypothetical protein
MAHEGLSRSARLLVERLDADEVTVIPHVVGSPDPGAFRVSNLAAGRYRLTVESEERTAGLPAFRGDLVVDVPSLPVRIDCLRP